MARLVNPEFIRVTAPLQGQILDQVKVGAWPLGTTPASHPDGARAIETVVPVERSGDVVKVPLDTLRPRLEDGVDYDVWVQGVNEGVTGPWVKDADDTIVAAVTPNITGVEIQ